MTGTAPEARVLIVDDEPMIIELLAVSLRFQGFEVATALSGSEALDRVRGFRPDALIVDVMMPGGHRAPASHLASQRKTVRRGGRQPDDGR